ncbi:hypothetical protein GNI_023790 [Gregarina niphandrodes]|uniref:Uncharacterized protein n=1 Tax=Gregarina niphandrodes TaxID=110365 RepID=A0A023BBS4_GRENI|nr:hypothetical protein GNI_023790 [Gregarina niphandrodes]EZG79919.1 hypothetical protein GNI_023790 [Gregarina niphandrodes]|eukprot:XP_011134364.1 hypothetical protein GNI_023790 [Gregarina niphandrodes]
MSASADGLCPSLQGPSMQSSSIHGHVWDTSPPGSSEGAAIRDRPSLTMEQKLRLLEKYRADMSYKLAVSDSVTVAVEYFSAKEKAGTLGEGETLAEEDALLEPDGTLIGTHLLSEHCRIKVLINVILERCIGGGPTTYLIDTLSTWCGSNPYKIHILIKKFQSIVKHADAFSDACIHNICYLYTQLIVNETIPLLLLHYTGVDRDGETNARLLTRLMLINLVEAWGFRLTKAKFAQDPKLVEIMATPSYIALLKDLGFLFLVPSNEQESCHLGKHHLSNNHLGNNHGVVQGVLQGGGNHSLVTGADECEPASRTPVCERSAYLTTFPSACEYRLPSHHAGHGLSLSAMHRESVGHHKHPPTGNPLAGNPPTGNPLAGNPLAGNPLAGHTKMGHLHEDGLVSKSADTLASGCSRVYYDAERGNICKVVCRPVRVEPIDESDSSDSVSNPSIELTESAHSSSISLTLGEPYLTDLSSDDEEHPKCTRRRLCRVVCVTSP